MSFCDKCGTQIKAQDSKFCSACGVPIAQSGQPPERQDVFPQLPPESAPTGGLGRYPGQAPYSPQYQPPYPPVYAPAYPQKEKHITFIFVSSLVFMIFFAIRCITGIMSIESWDMILNYNYAGQSDILQLYDAVMASLALTFVSFATALTFFILSCASKNRNREPRARIRLSKVLFGFSIAVLVCGAVYLASEILIFTWADSLDSVIIDGTQAAGSLAFDFAFVAFGIANLIKSLSFIKQLKQKNEKLTTGEVSL